MATPRHSQKTGLVKFNRWESDSSGKFTFIPPSSGSAEWLRLRRPLPRQGSLGFDFYWSRTMRNREHKMVKRRTNKKKYRAALAKMKEWIKEARNWPLRMILSSLRLKLRGYWNYYSVIGNSSATWKYYSAIKMLIYKWLNRRSQRKSYRWEKFKELFIGGWDIPAPRTVEQGEAGLQQQRLGL